jgi:hypothetical protein
MATLRQSFMALGYVLIFIPRLRYGSEVLMQRNFHDENEQSKLENLDRDLETRIYEKKVTTEELRAKKLQNPKEFK